MDVCTGEVVVAVAVVGVVLTRAPLQRRGGGPGDQLPTSAQHLDETLASQRPGVQVPLHGLAAEVGDDRVLLERLDALGDDPQAQGAGQGDDRGRHGAGRSGRGAQVPHEGPVDLEVVDGQVLEVGQRGVARAEVVDGDPHPVGPQFLQHLAAGAQVAGQGRLGDLQAQVAQLQAGRGHGAPDAGGETVGGQAHGRDVDGHVVGADGEVPRGLGRAPRREVVAGDLQDVGVQGRDEVRAFGQFDEDVGTHGPELGVRPAAQGLDAAQPRGAAGPDDGLVVHLDATAGQGLAQVRDEAQGAAGPGAHLLVEQGPAPTPGGLGLVHGDAGVAHDLLGAAAQALQEDDADAGDEPQPQPVDLHRDEHGLQDAFGRGAHGVEVGQVRADEDELVAAGPGHHVPGAHGAGQAAGDLDEDGVPGLRAQAVVDGLEVVEVDHEDPDVGALAGRTARQGQQVGQPFQQCEAVGQTRQQVVLGLVGQPVLAREAVGDVLDRADEAGPVPGGPAGGQPHGHPPDLAGGRPQAGVERDAFPGQDGGDGLHDPGPLVVDDVGQPAGPAQLLGGQAEQLGERVVDAGQPRTHVRDDRGHGGTLGEGGEPFLGGRSAAWARSSSGNASDSTQNCSPAPARATAARPGPGRSGTGQATTSERRRSRRR